jgi:protein TonB
MTQAFLHSLNIGTLSTWLSLAGFGTVGVIVHPLEILPPSNDRVEETQVVVNDFVLGDVAGAGNPGPAAAQPAPQDTPEAPAETLPAPPELPPLAQSEPLPEIPDLPAPAATRPAAEAPRESRTASRSSGSESSTTRPPATAGRGGSSGAGKPGGSATGGGEAGMSNAARLAAGRMPSPMYPAAARRGGQTGTVVVEFTVDTSGRVIAAHASQPSPWPLLNNEAVRTVRRWKFPPGGVMKLQRPIVFQLR